MSRGKAADKRTITVNQYAIYISTIEIRQINTSYLPYKQTNVASQVTGSDGIRE